MGSQDILKNVKGAEEILYRMTHDDYTTDEWERERGDFINFNTIDTPHGLVLHVTEGRFDGTFKGRVSRFGDYGVEHFIRNGRVLTEIEVVETLRSLYPGTEHVREEELSRFLVFGPCQAYAVSFWTPGQRHFFNIARPSAADDREKSFDEIPLTKEDYQLHDCDLELIREKRREAETLAGFFRNLEKEFQTKRKK